MMQGESTRNFKGGSWDMRKVDRRREQLTIAFPDRRMSDRRASAQEFRILDSELTWSAKPGLDE